jgi:hypothetical protein
VPFKLSLRIGGVSEGRGSEKADRRAYASYNVAGDRNKEYRKNNYPKPDMVLKGGRSFYFKIIENYLLDTVSRICNIATSLNLYLG